MKPKSADPLILAVETSGAAASVALGAGDFLGETVLDSGRTHAAGLFPAIKALLDKSGLKAGDVDAFAVSIGPGSYTGLRIGVAAVKTLAYANAKPVVAVGTLDAAARALGQRGDFVVPTIDAYCGELYYAVFKDGERLTEDAVSSPEAFAEKLRGLSGSVFVAGSGAVKFEEKIKKLLPASVTLDAAAPAARAGGVWALAQAKFLAGEFSDVASLAPRYLRGSAAEERLAKGKG